MKKTLLAVFAFSFILAAVPSGANGITFEDLGAGEPNLLPGESLYFLKDWGRGIRKFFSFGSLRKATFHAKLINKLAAEIKALHDENDEQGLSLALNNYRENALRLRERISSLDETSENRKVDDLLNMLTDRIVKHGEVFGELESLSGIEEELKKARDGLETVVALAITKIDAPERFKSRVENLASALGDNPLRELRVVYALNRIEDKVSPEIQGKIRELENDLTSRFEGHFKAEPEKVVPHLSSLPVKSARDLGIFDEIRERVTDGDLKSELNIVRQNALRNGNGDIIKEEALAGIISEAEKATEELKRRITSDEYVSSKSVEELLERAEFHLVQANELFGEGQVGTAFGQATAAGAAAQNGLSQLRLRSEIKEDNLSLRIQFDDLVKVARAKNLTRNAAPELYEFFDRAEKAVLLADTAPELREARVMLAELEVLIINGRNE